MKTIYHFFRLIRIINIFVIGLTMVVVELFLLRYNSIPPYNYFNEGYFLNYYSFELEGFYLLLLSTLLIAAAGNIINDYFDVKADRINKPNRLIIGKHIKRRWAMVLHWSFNVIGLIIALYVGYFSQNIWIPLIAFSSINLLWFYSAYYKRKPLIGNLIVALLLGVIPIYVLVFHQPNFNLVKQHILVSVLFISVIAFLMNLCRELIKDIQDIRGDIRLDAETFPIKYGIKRTKYLIVFISSFLVLVMFSYIGHTIDIGLNMNIVSMVVSINFFYLLIASLLFLVFSIFTLLISKNKKTYKIASLLLKLSMILGLLTPLFL